SRAGSAGAISWMLASDGGTLPDRSPRTRGAQPPAVLRLALRPRRPAARISGSLASDGGSPAPRRPAARTSGSLASDGGSPAPRRPAARTTSWGEASEGGRSPPPSVLVPFCIRVSFTVRLRLIQSRFAEPVAYAPDGLETRRREPRRRELGAQPRHVDVHGSRLHEPVLSPDQVQQLLAPEDSAGIAHQRRQKLELLRSQLHALSLHGDLEAMAIDLELARLEVDLPARGLGRLAPPYDRADPGQQLAGREGLGDIVVGAHLE